MVFIPIHKTINKIMITKERQRFGYINTTHEFPKTTKMV